MKLKRDQELTKGGNWRVLTYISLGTVLNFLDWLNFSGYFPKQVWKSNK
jgi:hypothetical protein